MSAPEELMCIDHSRSNTLEGISSYTAHSVYCSPLPLWSARLQPSPPVSLTLLATSSLWDHPIPEVCGCRHPITCFPISHACSPLSAIAYLLGFLDGFAFSSPARTRGCARPHILLLPHYTLALGGWTPPAFCFNPHGPPGPQWDHLLGISAGTH